MSMEHVLYLVHESFGYVITTDLCKFLQQLFLPCSEFLRNINVYGHILVPLAVAAQFGGHPFPLNGRPCRTVSLPGL